MAIWGEVSFRVRRAIIFLEQFTIAQLADMTSLEYQSVETVVHRLRQEGYIVHAQSSPESSSAKVGRPRQTYALVSDPQKREALYASIQAFQAEMDLAEASARAADNAHFDRAVTLIDALESGEREISDELLVEIERHLSLSHDLEELQEEGMELVEADTAFQLARLRLLAGDPELAAELLERAKATYQEHGLDAKVRQVVDYEMLSVLGLAVSSALTDAGQSRFDSVSHCMDIINSDLSLHPPSPGVSRIVRDMAEIVGLVLQRVNVLSSERQTLLQMLERLESENVKLRLSRQNRDSKLVWLSRPSGLVADSMPGRGFVVPGLRGPATETASFAISYSKSLVN